jgi:predicted heme/steroid binding protein
MPVKPISFGKPYPKFDASELQDNIGAQMLDTKINELGDYCKRPGLSLFATITGSKPVNGIYEAVNGIVYAVSNGKVWRIASDGTPTEITGSGMSSNIPTYFTEDGTNVFMSHGSTISSATSAAYAQMSGVTAASHVAWAKGFLLSNGITSGGKSGDVTFNDQKASAYPVSAWEYYNNEQKSDACNGLFVQNGEVYATGPRSIEVSWDDGSTPWAPIESAYLDRGAWNGHTFKAIGEGFIFPTVANGSRKVAIVENRQIRYVHAPIQTILDSAQSIDTDCYGWTINVNGDECYVIRLKTGSSTYRTMVYDYTRDVWYEWRYYNTSAYEHWVINSACYVQGWGKMLIGDRQDTGKIYELSATNLTDAAAKVGMELWSGNLSRGMLGYKRSNAIIFKCKRGQTASTTVPGGFTWTWRNELGAWATGRTVSLGVKDDTENITRKETCLGQYVSRQYKLVHEGTDTDCIVSTVEEDFDYLK